MRFLSMASLNSVSPPPQSKTLLVRGQLPSRFRFCSPRLILLRSRPQPAFCNGAIALQDYYYASLTHQSHYADQLVCTVVLSYLRFYLIKLSLVCTRMYSSEYILLYTLLTSRSVTWGGARGKRHVPPSPRWRALERGHRHREPAKRFDT